MFVTVPYQHLIKNKHFRLILFLFFGRVLTIHLSTRMRDNFLCELHKSGSTEYLTYLHDRKVRRNVRTIKHAR
jgi:hypothetical protein